VRLGQSKILKLNGGSYMYTSLSQLLEKRSARLAALLSAFELIRYLSFHNHGFTTGPTICIFKLITGYPCPVCGTTRAIAALSEGKFHDSISFNPLAIFIFIAVVLWAFRIPALDRRIRNMNTALSNRKFHEKLLMAFCINLLMWVWDFSRI